MDARNIIWTVGSASAAAGSSTVAANIGASLALRGQRVALLDLDGGGGLRACLGVKGHAPGLKDYLEGRLKSPDEACMKTAVDGLVVVPGAAGIARLDDASYALRDRLVIAVAGLHAGHIIVDAGATDAALDLFALSGSWIMVVRPGARALEDAFGLLKRFVYRRLDALFGKDPSVSAIIKGSTGGAAAAKDGAKTFSDLCQRIAETDRAGAERALLDIRRFSPRLILNMAGSDDDIIALEPLLSAAKTFLDLDVDFIGAIYLRPSIAASALRGSPFVCDDSALDARPDMERVVEALLAREEAPAAVEEAPPPQEIFGFNDNVHHRGTVFHVQTEVQAGDAPVIETVIYQGGRIFFSKRTLWSEVPAAFSGMDVKDFANRQHRAAMAAVRMDKITLGGAR
jgi:MinD-like ATPase involved in chromosome partitioning or flagellar assembly